MVDVATALAAYPAGLFFWASVQKIRDRDAFRASVVALGAGPSAASAAAVVVPAVEALGALLLLAATTRLIGAGLLASLLLLFTFILADNLRRGNAVPCSCFGARDTQPISRWTVARNIWLLLVVVVSSVLPRGTIGLGDIAVSCSVGAGVVLVHALATEAVASARALVTAARSEAP